MVKDTLEKNLQGINLTSVETSAHTLTGDFTYNKSEVALKTSTGSDVTHRRKGSFRSLRKIKLYLKAMANNVFVDVNYRPPAPINHILINVRINDVSV